MGAQNIVLTAAQKAAGATELIGIDSSGNIKDTQARVAAFQASVSGALRRSTSDIWCVQAGHGASSASITSARTWQIILGTRLPCYALRVAYHNPRQASYTVAKAYICPSSTYTSGGIPTGGQTPVQLTFSGATTVTVPAASANKTVTVWSDIVYVWPLARTDVPTANTLWHVRTYIDGLAANPYYGIANQTNYPGNTASGLVRFWGSVAGDAAAFTDSGIMYNDSNVLPMSVEFFTKSRTVRIAGCGDSVTSSISCADGGYTRYNLAERVAAAVNTALAAKGSSATATGINWGWGSQTYTQFVERLPELINQFSPDVVLIPAMSVNEPISNDFQYSQQWGRLMYGVKLIRASGAIPVIWACQPRNSLTSAQDTYRRQINAEILTWGTANGVICVDSTTGVGNGATPEQILPAIDVGDGIHLQSAGVDMLAAQPAARIAALI